MVWGMVFKEWEKKFALKEEAGHTLRAAGDAFSERTVRKICGACRDADSAWKNA